MGISGFAVVVVFYLRAVSASSGCLGRHNPDSFGPSSSSSSSSPHSSPPTTHPHPYHLRAVALGDRLLPHLPSLVFHERELLPAANLSSDHHDVPIPFYHRQRLLRALGAIRANTILPPTCSEPTVPPDNGARRRGQFTGDYSVVTWNAQALFAVNPGRHEVKDAYIRKLMAKADIALLTETHGSEVGNSTWRGVPNTTA